MQEPQPGVFCIPNYPILCSKAKKVVSKSKKKVMVVKKGQIIIILLKAYLLNFLIDFLNLYMQIIVLLKPDPMVESGCLCS